MKAYAYEVEFDAPAPPIKNMVQEYTETQMMYQTVIEQWHERRVRPPEELTEVYTIACEIVVLETQRVALHETGVSEFNQSRVIITHLRFLLSISAMLIMQLSGCWVICEPPRSSGNSRQARVTPYRSSPMYSRSCSVLMFVNCNKLTHIGMWRGMISSPCAGLFVGEVRLCYNHSLWTVYERGGSYIAPPCQR